MENKYIPNQVDLFIYILVTMQPVVYTKAIHVHFTKKNTTAINNNNNGYFHANLAGDFKSGP